MSWPLAILLLGLGLGFIAFIGWLAYLSTVYTKDKKL
jgi:hypothetical protein